MFPFSPSLHPVEEEEQLRSSLRDMLWYKNFGKYKNFILNWLNYKQVIIKPL